MKKICFFFFCAFPLLISAQNIPAERIPDAGGTFDFRHSDEITESDRGEIIKMLKANAVKLSNAGIDLKPNNTQVTLFIWPLRQGVGFNDNGYYGISNYVDENLAFPNQLLDYNCGNRTYDQASGYNHKGTDIFSWPFSWSKMDANAVEVIAAAPGVIIGKSDNNYDKNCTLSGGNWNAVYVQHADGSVAWYGHMKSGSLTSKLVGQSVSAGEYLGVVGSSGNSTGPHLHFEVYTNSSYTKLVDPWNGPCNSMNPGLSWWANQEPYRVSTLNTILTHAAVPQLSGCGTDSMRVKTVYAPKDPIHFGSYFRDPIAGHVTVHKVYTPTDSLWKTWTHTAPFTGAASGWVFSFNLPDSGSHIGTWKYEVNYLNQTLTRNFIVDTLPDLRITSVAVAPASVVSGDSVTIDFSVNNAGYATAPPHKVLFYLSADTILNQGVSGDLLMGEIDVTASLAVLATESLSKKVQVPCEAGNGNKYVIVVADGNKMVAEYKEENNAGSKIINVTSGLPPINIVQDNASICAGASITLSATGGTSYSWTPATSLNTTTGATVIATPSASTKYRVLGTAGVCSNSDSVLISVLPVVTPSVTISYSGCPSSTLLFQAQGTNAGSAAQYKWFVNNTIAGTGQSYTLSNAANGVKVYATLTSSLQCVTGATVSSDTTTVNCITTSITEVEGVKKYRLLPNPFTSQIVLNLEMDLFKPVSLFVLDVHGRELYRSYRGKLNGVTTHTLDGTAFPGGIYFLKVQIGDRFFTEKLVKLN